MRDPASARAFLQGEVEALEAFEFLIVGPAQQPLHRIEIARAEDQSLSVAVPGRPPILPELEASVRSALRERGFSSEDASDQTEPWAAPVESAEAAVALGEKVLREVFGEKSDAALDVVHGSRKAEHEARVKRAEVRERVESVLVDMMGSMPEQDTDQDYLLPIGDVRVVVAPRALPGGPALIRVFAVTNVGVNVVPELGILLARLNFGLSMGIEFDTYLIDEVTGAGDASFRSRSVALFHERMSKADAIMVNHNLGELKEFCAAALVLEHGKLRYFEDLDEAIEAHKANLS